VKQAHQFAVRRAQLFDHAQNGVLLKVHGVLLRGENSETIIRYFHKWAQAFLFF